MSPKKTLVRIPNPVSTLDSIFTTFNALHNAYQGQSKFSLEQSVSVGVDENLMASKGHVGAEARARSYNEDSSRDSMFNQFKMYAEVFRLLGWIRSASDNDRTSYCITFLGNLVATAKVQILLLEQSLLAMSFPNNASNVLFKNRVFPFRDLLLTMVELDGYGTRDEFIVGPLSLGDSDDVKEFSVMLKKLSNIRDQDTPSKRSAALNKALDSLCEDVNLKKVSAQNYTRIPIAALKKCWAEISTAKIYSGNTTLLVLNEKGRQTADWLRNDSIFAPHCDFVTDLPFDQAQAISLFGFIDLLKRASFDTAPLESIAESMKPALSQIEGYTMGQEILFNPYQNFSPSKLSELLGALLSENTVSSSAPITPNAPNTIDTSSKPIMPESQITFVEQCVEQHTTTTNSRAIDLIDEISRTDLPEDAAALEVMTAFESANQDVFYPAVSEILTALGYRCDMGRPGVTGLRWDAFIHNPYKIPVEIKSPGEELFIQVKGIRQALENKVILESRKTYGGDALDTTTLVVGYYPPNDRAETGELIQDIRSTYGINIGIIDFRSLVRLLIRKTRTGVVPDPEQLRTLFGVINVD